MREIAEDQKIWRDFCIHRWKHPWVRPVELDVGKAGDCATAMRAPMSTPVREHDRAAAAKDAEDQSHSQQAGSVSPSAVAGDVLPDTQSMGVGAVKTGASGAPGSLHSGAGTAAATQARDSSARSMAATASSSRKRRRASPAAADLTDNSKGPEAQSVANAALQTREHEVKDSRPIKKMRQSNGCYPEEQIPTGGWKALYASENGWRQPVFRSSFLYRQSKAS